MKQLHNNAIGNEPHRTVWCYVRFCDKKTAQNRIAPIYIYLFYIKYINNLIIYELSGQPSISAFQFHVKTTSFWLKYKIKSLKV